jgi:hypothetical protein
VADSRSRWSRDGVWVVTSLAFRERERRDDISIGGCAAVDVGSNISLGQGVKAPAIYRLSCSCYVYLQTAAAAVLLVAAAAAAARWRSG